MKKIPVYKAEADDGLTQAIMSKASIAYNVPVFLDKEAIKEKALSIAAVKKHHASASNEGQIDLFYLKDILVTTGWNLNDDVFDKAETWAARNTAEDKQFNLNHNQKIVDNEVTYVNEIIGHMTSQYVINSEGGILADDSSIDDLPDPFHIVSTAVIYKYWQNEEFGEKINKIIAEIEEQTSDKPKWYVSMEALFSNFDYAIIDKQGNQKILPRSQASAFLTKHLRAYGGSGTYEGNKIGRLMRNLVFSGKGLVENPANPNSVIFSKAETFKPDLSKTSDVKTVLGYSTISNIVPTEKSSMNENELLVKQLEEVKAALKAEQTAKAELEKKLTEEANKSVQAKVEELTKATEVAKAETVEVKKQLEVKTAEVVEATKKLTETSEQLAKANEVLKKNEDEKRVLARKSTLISRANLDEKGVEALLASLLELSDASFDKYIEAAFPKKEMSDDEKKKAEDEKKKKEKEAAASVLETAQPSKPEVTSASVEGNGNQEVRNKIKAAYKASKSGKANKTEEAK